MAWRFSDRVEELLRDAGWHPNREVDIEDIVKDLEADGCETFPVVENFLREYAFLEIKCSLDDFEGVKTHVHFDPVRAGGLCEKVKIVYEEIVGKPLCIIGEMDTDILMMDPKGRVYNAFDQCLYLMNETIYEALENMLGGKRLTFITDFTPYI